MRIAAVITGIGITALALSGCASTTEKSEKAPEKTTVTETVAPPASATPTSATPTAATTAPAGMPQPPAGATQQESRTDNGVQFARYSVDGQQPQQVVDYYTGIWQGEGYTITSSGGGGGGYGQYGGSGAGATGSKSGSFVAVNAGGQTGAPTYFSVCAGADEQAVRQCNENNSNNNDQNNNDQNNDGN
jgi:type IV secretory pathway VirB10-like protein